MSVDNKNNWKKTIVRTFIVIAFLAFAIVAILYFLFQDTLESRTVAEHELKTYSEKVIKRLVDDKWDKQTFKSYATQDLAKDMDQLGKKYLDVQNVYNLLGQFKKIETFSLTDFQVYSGQKQATVNLDTNFENDMAHIIIIFVKKENEWLIQYLNVNSDLFLKRINNSLK